MMIDDLFDQFVKARVFSKLDFKSGYHQGERVTHN